MPVNRWILNIIYILFRQRKSLPTPAYNKTMAINPDEASFNTKAGCARGASSGAACKLYLGVSTSLQATSADKPIQTDNLIKEDFIILSFLPLVAIVLLNEASSGFIAETFSWSSGDYGFPAAPVYTLEIDNRKDFPDPIQ